MPVVDGRYRPPNIEEQEAIRGLAEVHSFALVAAWITYTLLGREEVTQALREFWRWLRSERRDW